MGRLQRQCQRLARLRSEATTVDLAQWCYPRAKPEQLHGWRLYNTRRAAEGFWSRCGRAVINGYSTLLWRPKSAPSVQQTDGTNAGKCDEIG
jgi:hypothetical protein